MNRPNAWLQLSVYVHNTCTISSIMMVMMEKKKKFKNAFPWSKLFRNIIKGIPWGRTPLADSSLLASGFCVVLTQKPGALSLTGIVTSVVTVLNQAICYAKLGSITLGSVYWILLWLVVLPCTIADNKSTRLTVNSQRIFLFGGDVNWSKMCFISERKRCAHPCGQRKARDC